MDFETATDKLNNALSICYGAGEMGLWDFEGFRVSASLEGDDFVVHCGLKWDGDSVVEPRPFRAPLRDLGDSVIAYIVAWYISEWVKFRHRYIRARSYVADVNFVSAVHMLDNMLSLCYGGDSESARLASWYIANHLNYMLRYGPYEENLSDSEADFYAAAQKLNDVLMKYYDCGYTKRLDTGVWDFHTFQVSAKIDTGLFLVRCSIRMDGDDIFTPRPFAAVLPSLKHEDTYYQALRYISDWVVMLPVDDKTHPYYIASCDMHEFTVKGAPLKPREFDPSYVKAMQKLDDCLQSHCPGCKHVEPGFWEHEECKIYSSLRNGKVKVQCAFKTEQSSVYPKSFEVPLSDLNDAYDYNPMVQYISNCVSRLPLTDTAHPYYIPLAKRYAIAFDDEH